MADEGLFSVGDAAAELFDLKRVIIRAVDDDGIRLALGRQFDFRGPLEIKRRTDGQDAFAADEGALIASFGAEGTVGYGINRAWEGQGRQAAFINLAIGTDIGTGFYRISRPPIK